MNRYQRMLDEQARTMGVASLPVVEETGGCASTDGKTVFLDGDFMSGVAKDGGQAGVRFVLAHELAHARQGMAGGHRAELDADRFAARSVARTGGPFEAIEKTMGRHFDQSATRTHPDRMRRLRVARSEFGDESKRVESHVTPLVKRRKSLDLPPTRRGDRNKTRREHTL